MEITSFLHHVAVQASRLCEPDAKLSYLCTQLEVPGYKPASFIMNHANEFCSEGRFRSQAFTFLP